jgi:hypothetical protein
MVYGMVMREQAAVPEPQKIPVTRAYSTPEPKTEVAPAQAWVAKVLVMRPSEIAFHVKANSIQEALAQVMAETVGSSVIISIARE